jgi:DNA-binding GntR family transcriptional regulator
MFDLIAEGKVNEVERAMRDHIAASLSSIIDSLVKMLDKQT